MGLCRLEYHTSWWEGGDAINDGPRTMSRVDNDASIGILFIACRLEFKR